MLIKGLSKFNLKWRGILHRLPLSQKGSESEEKDQVVFGPTSM